MWQKALEMLFHLCGGTHPAALGIAVCPLNPACTQEWGREGQNPLAAYVET